MRVVGAAETALGSDSRHDLESLDEDKFLMFVDRVIDHDRMHCRRPHFQLKGRQGEEFFPEHERVALEAADDLPVSRDEAWSAAESVLFFAELKQVGAPGLRHGDGILPRLAVTPAHDGFLLASDCLWYSSISWRISSASTP